LQVSNTEQNEHNHLKIKYGEAAIKISHLKALYGRKYTPEQHNCEQATKHQKTFVYDCNIHVGMYFYLIKYEHRDGHILRYYKYNSVQ